MVEDGWATLGRRLWLGKIFFGRAQAKRTLPLFDWRWRPPGGLPKKDFFMTTEVKVVTFVKIVNRKNRKS
jgi:hypothetical protein